MGIPGRMLLRLEQGVKVPEAARKGEWGLSFISKEGWGRGCRCARQPLRSWLSRSRPLVCGHAASARGLRPEGAEPMQQVWKESRRCIRRVRLSVRSGRGLGWRQDGLLALLGSVHRGMHEPAVIAQYEMRELGGWSCPFRRHYLLSTKLLVGISSKPI